jgi:hypothetical protein
LVSALEEVIQLAATSKTLSESCIKEVLLPVYKKGYKLDCTNYRDICLLNKTHKVFTKVLFDRLLPYAIAVRLTASPILNTVLFDFETN